MTISANFKGEVRVHGVKTLTAEAGPDDLDLRGEVSWLTIKTQTLDEIVLFMPYETALAYANAINTCNDRKAIEAEEPRRNTYFTEHQPTGE